MIWPDSSTWPRGWINPSWALLGLAGGQPGWDPAPLKHGKDGGGGDAAAGDAAAGLTFSDLGIMWCYCEPFCCSRRAWHHPPLHVTTVIACRDTDGGPMVVLFNQGAYKLSELVGVETLRPADTSSRSLND